jgi:hypothetical protein
MMNVKSLRSFYWLKFLKTGSKIHFQLFNLHCWSKNWLFKWMPWIFKVKIHQKTHFLVPGVHIFSNGNFFKIKLPVTFIQTFIWKRNWWRFKFWMVFGDKVFPIILISSGKWSNSSTKIRVCAWPFFNLLPNLNLEKSFSFSFTV